ncbi:MAG: phage tail tape measure protein [Candidatus Hodarchaeales archaeon]
MTDSKKLDIILQLKSNMDAQIKSADGRLQKLNRTVRETGKGFTDAGRALTTFGRSAAIKFAVLTAGIFKLTQAFSQFEKGMSDVSTLLDTNAESMATMSRSVLDMSKDVPVAISGLTSALFDIRSAGISAANSMDVLKQSAKLGVAGLGTTKESANALTLALNTFGDASHDAARVADILFKTTKFGVTTISGLTQAFGQVAGVAREANISLEELQAATAAMTKGNNSATLSQISLRAAILSIQAPTTQMADVIEKLGFESGGAMLKQIGLVESMKLLKKHTGGNVDALKLMFGRVEGLKAQLSLTGAQADDFTLALKGMTNGINDMDIAFAKQKETFDSSMKLFNNGFNRLSITIGSRLAPLIKGLSKAVGGLINLLDTPVIGTIIAGLLFLTTVVVGLSAAFTLLAGNLMLNIGLYQKLSAQMAGGVILTFMKNMTKATLLNTKAVLANSLAWLATPIGMVVAGIAIAVAALYLVWKTDFMGMRSWIESLFAPLAKLGKAIRAVLGLVSEEEKVNDLKKRYADTAVAIADTARAMKKIESKYGTQGTAYQDLSKKLHTLMSDFKVTGIQLKKLGHDMTLPKAVTPTTPATKAKSASTESIEALEDLSGIKTIAGLTQQKSINEQMYQEELSHLEALKELRISEGESQAAADQKFANEKAALDKRSAAAEVARISKLNTVKKKYQIQSLADLKSFLAEGAASMSGAADALKTVRTGEAIMNTYAGVTAALAGPFPINLANAGVVLAQGLFSVGQIQAQKFAAGTSRIEEDMVGQLGKDEIVVPKTFSDGIRSGELSLTSGKMSVPGSIVGGNESASFDSSGESDSVSGGGGDTFIFNGNINGVTEDLIRLIADGLRRSVSAGLVAPI